MERLGLRAWAHVPKKLPSRSLTFSTLREGTSLTRRLTYLLESFEISFAERYLFYRANGYQDEQSETWIGEWLEKSSHRDEIVLATKYTDAYKLSQGTKLQQSHFGGNGAKSLHLSVEASLKKLRTNYIDILYVHYWDMTTSIAEIMQSLNHLVTAGKVLYLGISDTPAWIVVKCNEYARQHGLRQFSLYQGRWSAASRDFEREIIPMCKAEGMALAPWGVLGGGHFRSSKTLKTEGRSMEGDPAVTGNEARVSAVLEKIAERKGTLITSIALAYVLHKTPNVFPICGTRKIEHLKGNIEALSLKLSQKDLVEIETAYDFDAGFPHNFIANNKRGPRGPQDIFFANARGHFEYLEDIKPIEPAGNS